MLLCLCAVLAFAPTAIADGEETEEMSIINEAEIQSIVTEYFNSKNIPADRVSIGFCYTATGDEWFMNGDEWVYPGSVYKVPLMMIMAEKVSSGEMSLDQVLTDSVITKEEGPYINGLTLAQINENIITRSNNNMAHDIRRYLVDEEWRTQAKGYARQDDAYYSSDYLTYCYFSARYITEVLETLYNDPDRFPDILECMAEATPNEYLRANLEGQYAIAQKYGSYEEPNGNCNRHAVGVIYTPNPIIVSIMTVNVTNPNAVIGKLAELLTQYALTLDSKLEIFEKQKLAAQVAAEQAAADQAAAEQRAAEEAEKAAAEKNAAEKAAAEAAAKEAEKAAAKAKRQAILKKAVKLCVTVVIIGAAVAAGAVIMRRRLGNRAVYAGKEPLHRRKYDEEFDEEYEDEDEDWDEEPAPAEIPVDGGTESIKHPVNGRRAEPAQRPAPEKVPAYAAKPVVFMDRFREDEFENNEYEDNEYDRKFSEPTGPALDRRYSEFRNVPVNTVTRDADDDAFEEESDEDFRDESFLSRLTERLNNTGSSLNNRLGRSNKQSGNMGRAPVKKADSGIANAIGSLVPGHTKKRGKHEL